MITWARAPLGDVLELLLDNRGKTPKKMGGDWIGSGIRVISAMNVKQGRVDNENIRYVSDDLYHRWMPNPLQPGDVLVTSEAPLGEIAYWSSTTEVVLGQRLFALRGTPGTVHGRFLYYWLTAADAQAQLQGRATGTTVEGIRQSQLVQLMVPVPPLAEQRAIADILGALDDKIESNGRLVAATSSCLMSLTKLIESLPRTALRSVTVTSREVIDPKTVQGSPVEHFSIPAFDRNGMPEVTSPSAILSGKFAIRGPRILVSRLNPRTPRVWHAVPVSTPALGSTEFLVLDDPAGGSLARVWLAVTGESFTTEMQRRATGTSGSHQRLRPEDALDIDVPDTRLADPRVLAEVDAYLGLTNQSRVESQTLAALRDALLPELLSGRLRAPEAREQVEAIA